MKVRIQLRGLKPIEIVEDVQSVVVYDQHDNPAYVAQQVDQNTIIHEKAGFTGFEKLLKTLGIGLNAAIKVFRR